VITASTRNPTQAGQDKYSGDFYLFLHLKINQAYFGGVGRGRRRSMKPTR